MSILQGEPPPPTIRSIIAGISLGLLLLLAFLNLPILFKYSGAILTFLPGKLGLMQVVKPEEVIPVDMSTSPTRITFNKSGMYILYTDDYDLLVINDAVAGSGAKPWLKIETEGGVHVGVKLIDRGLAIYDTPLAKGRPVATFDITVTGAHILTHPGRPVIAYIVPDYTSGHEGWINFLIIAELVALIIIIRDIRKAINALKENRQK